MEDNYFLVGMVKRVPRLLYFGKDKERLEEIKDEFKKKHTEYGSIVYSTDKYEEYNGYKMIF